MNRQPMSNRRFFRLIAMGYGIGVLLLIVSWFSYSHFTRVSAERHREWKILFYGSPSDPSPITPERRAALDELAKADRRWDRRIASVIIMAVIPVAAFTFASTPWRKFVMEMRVLKDPA